MTIDFQPVPPDPKDSALGDQQLLKYGRDLARIYVSEKNKRKKLQLAYRTLSVIFANTPHSLVVLDRSLVIRQANSAFGRLTEMPAEETVGKPIDEVLLSETLRADLESLDSEAVSASQIEILVSKPMQRSLLLTVARLQSEQIVGWVISVDDQTAAKRADQQKREFINIAAHELRTPLTALLGYSEILTDIDTFGAQSPESQRTFFHAIIENSQRLVKVIDELIRFAELNDEGPADHKGAIDFDLHTLIPSVIANLYQAAAHGQVDLRVDFAAPHIEMHADTSLLRTALYQIVLNAVSFNREGGKVCVKTTQQEDSVLIEVIDTGIGIPQTQLETIFDPFFQTEPHDTRHIGGLGLGLSIARRAVTELGGTITVDSAVGVGTCVSIALPIRQPLPEDSVSDLQAQLQTTVQQSLAYAHDLRILYRQLQEANRQLRDINVQLDEANKLKSDFLGVISHELRSPFVSIDFALQTFSRYGTDMLLPEQRDLLAQVARSFGDARRMIDNLIAFSSLLSKQGRLNLMEINIGQRIQETVIALSPMAVSRGLKLHSDLEGGLTGQADPERISEAIWALVHNAIKFTRAGGQVIVRAYKEAGRLTIQVEDTGIGIPQEKQATLWTPFSQLADPLKRGVEGLGIGLALVHFVAVAHGGDVFLESAPDQGSKIGFWLPLR